MYTYRFDDAHELEFMATVPATEEAGVWLLLVCKSRERLYLSLVHPTQFPFALKGISHLTLRLDGSAPISLPVAAIEQKLITADPRTAKDLLPLLVGGSKLVASIPKSGGAVHSYAFALQPNNLALKEVNAHCAPTHP